MKDNYLQLFATTKEDEKVSTDLSASLGTEPASAAGTDTAQAPATPQPQVYGGSYDQQISDLYNKISGVQPFSYDVNGDALYQQYKDRYTANAQKSMRDTLGQAASLTGGYGSSYGQLVGQQQYDTTMQGLTDMIPQLEQNAYNRYQGQLGQLKDQYGMLGDMAAQEANTMANAYNNIANLISTTGYAPTAEDLAKSGMSQEQADMLRLTWAFKNPKALEQAVKAGEISKDDYKKLTGKTWGGNGGAGYGYGGNPSSNKKLTQDDVDQYVRMFWTVIPV